MTVERAQARISEITSRMASLRAPVPNGVMVGRGTGLTEAGSAAEFSNLYAQALSAAAIDASPETSPTMATVATGSGLSALMLGLGSSRPASSVLDAFGRTTLGAPSPLGLSSATLVKALAGLGPAAIAQAAAATTTAQGKIGNFGPIAVPQELQSYGNGRVPTSVLAPIGIGSYTMWEPAADAFRQMAAAAKADGVTIGVRSTYRTYDEQIATAEKHGLYSEGGWAAAPGTSNHGWGLAVDINVDDQGQEWMRENGWRFGYVEAVPREPWHWEFRPAQSGAAQVLGTAR